jgi:type I restriction enzyme S subunit
MKNWEEEKGRTASLRKIKNTNIEKRKLVEGDILVEISGGVPEHPVGRTVVIDKTVLSFKPDTPKICTNFLRLIRPKNYVEGKFLNLYLKHFYYSGEIVKYQGGSNNLRNLKFPDYIKIKFPLPPLPTQLAIVSKIEELFSELDKGIENLRTAQQQLKTYRQAVLKWAFEGKLTNNLNHDELDANDEYELSIAAEPTVTYKAKNNNGSDKGELPDGWKRVTLGDVCKNVEYGSATKSKENGKVPVLRMGNIQNGRFNWDDLVYTDDDDE